ncbi:MAG: hypothetical protein AMXMBFR7_10450 [Planctomycetota bacterium]
MRTDMAKIIVERPRYNPGGSFPRAKDHAQRRQSAAAADELPRQLGMRRPWAEYRRRKSLNENLMPLRRFLHSRVGRPWNKVHAEIAEHLRLDSAVQLHIFQHLRDFVAVHTQVDRQGRIQVLEWGLLRTLKDFRGELYVDPRTGVLRRNPLYNTKARRRKRLKLAEGLQERRTDPRDPLVQYHRRAHVWYRIDLRILAQHEWSHKVSDVFVGTIDFYSNWERLQLLYGRSHVYGYAKCQLNRRELDRLGLRNGPKQEALPQPVRHKGGRKRRG